MSRNSIPKSAFERELENARVIGRIVTWSAISLIALAAITCVLGGG